MSESRVATFSSLNSRIRLGYVRTLCTRNPVSSGTSPAGVGTTTVCVWPPRRRSCSNKWTRCRRLSSEAAASPEMPAPMTAIDFMGIRNISTNWVCQSFVHDKHLTLPDRSDTLSAYSDRAQRKTLMGHLVKLAGVGAVAFMALDG